MTNWLITVLAAGLGFTAQAADTDFDPDTGLRIHHYTSETPMDVPGGIRVGAAETKALADAGAVLLDVLSIPSGRYDELDGTWPEHTPRENIPGSVWTPNVGFGVSEDDMQAYLAETVATLTAENKWHPIVVYCIKDCWMGWNATQHLAAMGYRSLFWFADGTDAWVAAGLPVEPSEPLPVNVD